MGVHPSRTRTFGLAALLLVGCSAGLCRPIGGAEAGQPPEPADRPAARTDEKSAAYHLKLVERARAGCIDIYFEGDSITRRWGALDRPDLLEHWDRNFSGWRVADFGWGGDTTQNILWRLDNGELDGVNPAIIVLLAGTNNVGDAAPPEGVEARAAGVTAGVRAIVRVLREKAPRAVIVLTAIFPRNDSPTAMPVIDRVNRNLAALADGGQVRWLNINPALAGPDGALRPGVMDPDRLHPAIPAYQVWADALKPIFTEILGPPTHPPRPCRSAQ